MTIQQGFNRIGLAVAAAFVGLSLICAIAAATNYLEYRSEVAAAHQKFFGNNPDVKAAIDLLKTPDERAESWNRFKQMRYRSVEQALNLALMCLLAGIIALVFWFAVGRAYVFVSTNYQSKYG